MYYPHDEDTFPGGYEAYISALRRSKMNIPPSAETIAFWLLNCIDARLESINAQLELISGRTSLNAVGEVQAVRAKEAAEWEANRAMCFAALQSRGLNDRRTLNVLARRGYDGSSAIKLSDLKAMINIGAKSIKVLADLGLVDSD